MRRLVIAGVTGSIGQQALDSLASIGDLEVIAVGAGSKVEEALAAAQRCGSQICTVETEPSDRPDQAGVDLRVGTGSMAAAIRELQPDVVLNAVVGFAGVDVTRAAIEVGAELALANKESLVAGGSVVTQAAAAAGIRIIPVDSEHAALAQLLEGEAAEEVESITLTASGGPFRGKTSESLAGVSVEDALRHPTWAMGGKITIDSATLMNKGLEVIEAERLFGFTYDQISVVVHPQSIVHALVSFRDGIQTGHLGIPDMRSPIAWALAGGSRQPMDLQRLDLASVGSLDFEAPDLSTFRSLRLAYDAGRAGGGSPAVLNAANEVAVESFLAGRIQFVDIADVVEGALNECGALRLAGWDDVTAADEIGRSTAERLVASKLIQ